jgi:hypothetical protein
MSLGKILFSLVEKIVGDLVAQYVPKIVDWVIASIDAMVRKLCSWLTAYSSSRQADGVDPARADMEAVDLVRARLADLDARLLAYRGRLTAEQAIDLVGRSLGGPAVAL